MSNINASGEFYYSDNTNNGNDYIINTGDISQPLYTINNSNELSFFYKNEWIPFSDLIDKLERMEKFINAFVETFDGYFINSAHSYLREIWNKSEKLNFEEAHKDYHDYINDGDLKIDI